MYNFLAHPRVPLYLSSLSSNSSSKSNIKIKSKKNVANTTSIDASVAEGMTSKKTKTLAKLNSLTVKKTSMKKQGDSGKAVLIGKEDKHSNLNLHHPRQKGISQKQSWQPLLE